MYFVVLALFRLSFAQSSHSDAQNFVLMVRLLSKFANFNLPKLPKINANKVIHLARHRSNGEELQFQAEGMPPDEGMFGVFWLNNTQVLVQYVRRLPFHGKFKLDDDSYRFVKPLPTTSEVKEGRKSTMFVGSSHFLVQFIQVLAIVEPPMSAFDSRCLPALFNRPPTAAPVSTSAPVVSISVTSRMSPQPIAGPSRPVSSNAPQQPRDPSYRKGPPAVAPIEIAIVQETTTARDPRPLSTGKNLPPLPTNDRPKSRTRAQDSGDISLTLQPPSPPPPHKTQPQSHPPVLKDGRRVSEPQTQHVRFSSVSHTPTPRPKSTPLGDSPLRNEITLSTPSSIPAPSTPARPTTMEGLDLRNFPGSLTPSPVVCPDELGYNASREATPAVKPALLAHSPLPRDVVSDPSKTSKHSPSKSFTAVPSTRTPNPRTPISLYGDSSPPRHDVTSTKNAQKLGRRHYTIHGASGAGRPPVGLGLELNPTASDPQYAAPRFTPSPTPSPVGRHSSSHRRSTSVRASTSRPTGN